jgi:hypothetical protein
MNNLIASAYNAANGFALPTRVYSGLTLEALSVIGITVDGEKTAAGFRHCMMPAGWTPVASDESPMQLRWQDAQGRLRAKIYYKPGSQGGGATMELIPRFTTSLATNDTLQWGEVYDGKELLHRTSSGPKTVDKMDLTDFTQPQYGEAEAWLAAIHPDHKNPLAYWN